MRFTLTKPAKVLCCLLLAALGISQLRVDDDIRRLQPLPVELQAQESQIKTLTGQQGGMQGFLVTGADGEQALQRLERLDGRLAELKQRGVLQDFVSLSRWLPSLARQQQDAAAIRALLPQVVTRLQEAGVPIPAGGQAPVREPGWLTPAAWLASPVSEGSVLSFSMSSYDTSKGWLQRLSTVAYARSSIRCSHPFVTFYLKFRL